MSSDSSRLHIPKYVSIFCLSSPLSPPSPPSSSFLSFPSSSVPPSSSFLLPPFPLLLLPLPLLLLLTLPHQELAGVSDDLSMPPEESSTPEQCLAKLTALIRVFTTVLKALGTNFSPARCHDITPSYLKDVSTVPHHIVETFFQELMSVHGMSLPRVGSASCIVGTLQREISAARHGSTVLGASYYCATQSPCQFMYIDTFT